VSRSEAERTLGELVKRARVAAALLAAATVAVGRQTGVLPEELTSRLVLVAAAFAAGAVAAEGPARLGRRELAALATVVCDLAATALAIAALSGSVTAAPALMLWPIFASGFVGSPLLVLMTGLMAAAVLPLAGGAAAMNVSQMGGWAALCVGGAGAHAEVLRRFGHEQRAAESAFAKAAQLARTMTFGEVAEVVFAYLDEVLGTAARLHLLYDDAADGRFNLVAGRGLTTSAKASFAASDLDGLAVGDDGTWVDPDRIGCLADHRGADASFAFALSLRHGRRVTGYVIALLPRQKPVSEAARRGLGRLAADAASALERIRLDTIVARQRSAMTMLLGAREAARDIASITSWSTKLARELTAAEAAWLVWGDTSDQPRTRPSDEDAVPEDARLLCRAALQRAKPIFISDASTEERFRLGPTFARGSLAVVPVPEQPIALVVYHTRPERFSSGELQLLIMLADQVSLVLRRNAHVGALAGTT
jgi:GAF domain-containing protein